MARKSAAAKTSAEPLSLRPLIDRGLRVSVPLPIRMVRQKLGFLRRNGLGAQIALYDTNWICNYPANEVAETAALLKEAGIELTAHGPIYDMNPGSLDLVIRDYTRHCYFKTLGLCRALGVKAIILHLGLNPLLPESALDSWFTVSVQTWRPIVELAEQLGLTIRLENMFTSSPEFLVNLKRNLKSDAVKVCFDIGHFNIFSKTPLKCWLDEIGDDLDEVHLNDNNGREDEHLEFGKGNIDFNSFFAELSAHGVRPEFTIEMTSEKFQRSFAYLAKHKLLEPFVEA